MEIFATNFVMCRLNRVSRAILVLAAACLLTWAVNATRVLAQHPHHRFLPREHLSVPATCGAGADIVPARMPDPAPPNPYRTYRTSQGILVHLYRLPRESTDALAVNGNTLIWSSVQGSRQYPELYEADLRAFHPRILAQGTACNVFPSVHLSPNWIVWVSPTAQSQTVWALDRRTGRRYRVASQPFAAPCAGLACMPPFEVGLSGNDLVWPTALPEARGMVRSSLLMRTLPNGSVHAVFSTDEQCAVQSSPQLAGGVLVWQRFRWTWKLVPGFTGRGQGYCDSARTDVLAMNLRTRRVIIVNQKPGTSRPSTNGRYVSWEQGQCFLDCYAGTLFKLDLWTGLRTQVDGPMVKAQRMAGSMLVWHREGGHGITIEAQDLQTGRRYVLAHEPYGEGAPILDLPGWGWGRRVIWAEREFLPRGIVGYMAVADIPPS
ncbi:MAG TPA: hypothetical protein VF898_08775 [Chloroflexota bacterium]